MKMEFGIRGKNSPNPSNPTKVNHLIRRNIKFDEPTHKYTDEDGNPYIPATTLIGLYEEPFDEEYWLMFTALKRNGYKPYPILNKRIIKIKNKEYTLKSLYSQEDKVLRIKTSAIKKEWIKTNKDACDKGNKHHNLIEDEINKFSNTMNIRFDDMVNKGLTNSKKILNKEALYNSQIRTKYPTIYNRLLALLKGGWTIHAEKRIYSYYYLIAGTIDVLCTKGKNVILLDWKTNKDSMKFTSGYYKKVNGVVTNEWISKEDTLKYPLNRIQDCKGMIYTIQLSLYGYICELWGYKVVKLELCHLINKEEPKFYDIEYRKQDVHKMILHYTKTKNRK